MSIVSDPLWSKVYNGLHWRNKLNVFLRTRNVKAIAFCIKQHCHMKIQYIVLINYPGFKSWEIKFENMQISRNRFYQVVDMYSSCESVVINCCISSVLFCLSGLIMILFLFQIKSPVFYFSLIYNECCVFWDRHISCTWNKFHQVFVINSLQYERSLMTRCQATFSDPILYCFPVATLLNWYTFSWFWHSPLPPLYLQDLLFVNMKGTICCNFRSQTQNVLKFL